MLENKIGVTQALVSLIGYAGWSTAGDEVFYTDEQVIRPTIAEITAEVARLQAEYDSKEYQRQRAKAYPSITDQLDLIYHGGIDAWKATITAVKEEFPK